MFLLTCQRFRRNLVIFILLSPPTEKVTKESACFGCLFSSRRTFLVFISFHQRKETNQRNAAQGERFRSQKADGPHFCALQHSPPCGSPSCCLWVLLLFSTARAAQFLRWIRSKIKERPLLAQECASNIAFPCEGRWILLSVRNKRRMSRRLTILTVLGREKVLRCSSSN